MRLRNALSSASRVPDVGVGVLIAVGDGTGALVDVGDGAAVLANVGEGAGALVAVGDGAGVRVAVGDGAVLVAVTARYALMRPQLQELPVPLILSAVLQIRSRICALVNPWEASSPASPATCGVAIEVPLIVL